MKQTLYFMSRYPEPPFQLYRWTLDTTQSEFIDRIDYWDIVNTRWAEYDETDREDNLVRRSIMGYEPSLKMIDPPDSLREVNELSRVGWRARRFEN